MTLVDAVTVDRRFVLDSDVRVVASTARAVVVDDGKVGVCAIAVSVGIDLVAELSAGSEVEDCVTVEKAVVAVAGFFLLSSSS